MNTHNPTVHQHIMDIIHTHISRRYRHMPHSERSYIFKHSHDCRNVNKSTVGKLPASGHWEKRRKRSRRSWWSKKGKGKSERLVESNHPDYSPLPAKWLSLDFVCNYLMINILESLSIFCSSLREQQLLWGMRNICFTWRELMSLWSRRITGGSVCHHCALKTKCSSNQRLL